MLKESQRRSEDIDLLFTELVSVYHELHVPEEQLPNLVKENESKTSTDESKSAAGDNLVEITQKLMESIRSERFADYTDIAINLENEQTCLETLHLHEAAQADARKRVVYFSCLEGQVLKRLKEITGKKMSQLLHDKLEARF